MDRSKLPLFLLFPAMSLAACSGISASQPPSDVVRVKPSDRPLPPHEPTSEYPEAMNTEFCLGSCAEEEARFREFAKQIQALQTHQTSRRGQKVARGFHAKAHACLYGTMELNSSREPNTRFGIFADGQPKRDVWVRYSNGVGWSQADSELDARGMAVKVMGVTGDRLTTDETATQDFLMTNSPTPVGRNAEEFMKFAHANESGFFSGLGFLLTHPSTGAPALMRTGAVPSSVTQNYFGGSAYHLGAHQAIKYAAKPCAGTKARDGGSHGDADYLRDDLTAAAKEGVCYTMYVQYQVDPERTPIEHSSIEWTADASPFVAVATITMPPQDIADPRRAAFCDKLSYNPWHGIVPHQPMGHINRARRFVYYASESGRAGGYEPHGFEGFDKK